MSALRIREAAGGATTHIKRDWPNVWGANLLGR
jgi:hypothetical protein